MNVFWGLLLMMNGASASATANTECAELYPIVKSSAKAWSKQNAVTISPSAIRTLQTEYCAAAGNIIKAGRRSRKEVASVAAAVTSDFLDRQTDKDRPGQTMEGAILSELGEPGLSRPAFKRYVLVRFRYQKKVDRIFVGNERFGAIPSLLLPVGSYSVRGMLVQTQQCKTRLTLVEGGAVEYTCQ